MWQEGVECVCMVCVWHVCAGYVVSVCGGWGLCGICVWYVECVCGVWYVGRSLYVVCV